MKKNRTVILAALIAVCLTGCAQAVSLNPFLYLSDEQTLETRALTAKGTIKVVGKSYQQIIDLLGQPNDVTKDFAKNTEEWQFIYYSPTLSEVSGKKRSFILTLKNGRVTGIDSLELLAHTSPKANVL